MKRSSVSRLGALTLVIWVKPPRLRTLPSEFRLMLDTFVPGLEKCGVLVAFSASARNCTDQRSVTLKARKMLMSRLRTPGPRRLLKPAVPNRGCVTEAYAVGSNQEFGLSKISTSGLT